MKKSHEKIVVAICRIILGVVFIFSGFVKAVDPWGSAYKMLDYFAAFEFTALNFVVIPLAFLQVAVEFGVGLCLLLGVYRRLNSILALLIMLFMTPLTLYLSITNPVTDCGCFGDALVISNWQTFYKNIFLLTAAIIVFRKYKYMTACFTRKHYFLVSSWIYLFIAGVSLYCFYHLPILDFRPYKIGVNIPQKMEIPEDAEHDVYETRLIYSKDDRQKEFTIENYPKNDTTWTFVDSKSRVIKKGYQPPIHDFSITGENGNDITDEILSNPSYTFLLIAHKLGKAGDSNVDRINEIYDFSKSNGYGFYALTSSLSDEIREWTENTGAEYPFCTVDDITLKTIIRSNPGLLLIKEGTIINKWPNTRLPDSSELNAPLEESAIGKTPEVRNVRTVLLLTLFLLAPLTVLFFFNFARSKRKRRERGRDNEGNERNEKMKENKLSI